MNAAQINRVRKDIRMISAVSRISSIMKFVKAMTLIIVLLVIGKDIFMLAKAE